MEMSDYEVKALQKLGESIHDGKWSNGGLVQLIELAAVFLNPLTISDFAKSVGKSYNGIKKTKKTTEILGIKFIIDNE